MELNDRFNILIQGSQIAQSKGILSLDDAVYVKKAIDCIKNNTELKIAVKILLNTVTIAQSNGCYTLKDAYLIYIALNGIEELIPEELTEDTETEKNEK